MVLTGIQERRDAGVTRRGDEPTASFDAGLLQV
jgi:hypothetical protein